MLTSIKFTKNWRCFKKGDTFEIRPLTLLVGDQGTGKSSLVQQLALRGALMGKEKASEKPQITWTKGGAPITAMRSLDFEHDNPRTAKAYHPTADILSQLVVHFVSHGEAVRPLLRFMETETKPTLWVMDEPDMALSPRSAWWLARLFQDAVGRGHQIVACVHNPILIAAAGDVLSVEHRRWLPGEEFLRLHQTTNAG